MRYVFEQRQLLGPEGATGLLTTPFGKAHFGLRAFLHGRKNSRVHMTGNPTEERIALCGELDLADKEALTASLRAAETADLVILDLTDVTYVDSTILGCFVHLRTRVAAHGGSVRLIGVRPNIFRLLETTGLDRVFGITHAPA